MPDMEPQTKHSRAGHAVDILAFVEAQEIPSDYFETPYYLAPLPGGENVYALLREALREAGKIGIAYVVIQSRQHLAALVPSGQSLILNTLRWTAEDGSPADTDDADEAEPAAVAGTDAGGTPSASGSHSHCELFQHRMPALEEQIMKTKKGSEHIIVEELEGLLEDEEMFDEDYLATIVGRRMHPPDGSAARRSHPLRWHARGRVNARGR